MARFGSPLARDDRERISLLPGSHRHRGRPEFVPPVMHHDRAIHYPHLGKPRMHVSHFFMFDAVIGPSGGFERRLPDMGIEMAASMHVVGPQLLLDYAVAGPSTHRTARGG